MSDTTDTPITDKHIGMIYRDGSPLIETCRDLERQLAEAREQLTEWRTLTSWGGTPEIIDQFIRGQQTRIHAAQNAEEQRDRLAEALRPFASLNPRSVRVRALWDRYVHAANAALATLDRKEGE
jgi:DNA-binding transcriptional MerR regulator